MSEAVFTDELLSLDKQLLSLVSDIDILNVISPVNYEEEKTAFFDSRCTVEPKFKYVDTKINVFQKKRALFNLPIDSLPNEDLATLYMDVIESYADKLEQYTSIGSSKFRYDSLRYYGEPSEKDLRNAHFVLHLPDTLQNVDESALNADEIAAHMREFAQEQGYPLKLDMKDNMIANALVSGDLVKINKKAVLNFTETKALAHHELGVHLVTTLNAQSQKLNVLRLGSPVNTKCQEGLAILCEYLAGCLTIPRLKILALRVLAVESMLKEDDFRKTFALLREEHKLNDKQAFTITARVYRGGGFTKDYLYLRGFHQMLNAYETQDNFNHLLLGKLSLPHLPLISRLIESGYFTEPKLISPAIRQPEPIETVQQFIAHSIK